MRDFGYYPANTEFDRHSVAVGLVYKTEYQDRMTDSFTNTLKSIVNIQMFTRKKEDGKSTISPPLSLDPCSTLDL
jgi:hypothetical protein